MMTITGVYNDNGLLKTLIFLSDKFLIYIDQFQFKEAYDINYLPSALPMSITGQYMVKQLNVFIKFLILVNLFLFFAIANYSVVLIVKKLFITANGLTIKEKLNNSVPYLFMFFAIAPLLGLFVYDAATAFYRSFYINLLMAITNGMVLSYSTNRLQRILKPIGVLSLLICFCSNIVTFEIIRPKIQSGQVGPSIAIDTDWNSVKADVNQLKQACDINDKTAKVMMDDLTYDALKQHSHLIAVSYFLLSANLSGGGTEDQLQASRELFKRVSPNAAIMRCDLFSLIDKRPASQKSLLCCAKF